MVTAPKWILATEMLRRVMSSSYDVNALARHPDATGNYKGPYRNLSAQAPACSDNGFRVAKPTSLNQQHPVTHNL
jgi:hypothetical protein